MITYSSDVTIARPAGDIFPWLVEREKQAQWSDVPMEALSEGPLRQGSDTALQRMVAAARTNHRRRDRRGEIAELVRLKKVVEASSP